MPDGIHGIFHSTEHHDHHNKETCYTESTQGREIGVVHIIKDRINGLMQVQLETSVPVFSVVLTPHHFHSHDEHQDFFREHFIKKGQEAAEACATILESLQAVA